MKYIYLNSNLWAYNFHGKFKWNPPEFLFGKLHLIFIKRNAQFVQKVTFEP